MTIIKHFLISIFYTFLLINCVIMTLQYILGINSIADRFYDMIDIAGIF